MATLKINGDTSGYVELVSPAVAGSTSIALDKILVADSSGNVGIGVSDPDSKLEIVSHANQEPLTIQATTNSYNYITHRNSAGTDVAYTGLGGGAAVTTGAVTDYAIRATTNLLFGAGSNSERMRIDSSGNVGIGTTSPNSILHVKSPAFTDSTIHIDATSNNVSQRIDFRAAGTLTSRIYDDSTSLQIIAVANKSLRFKVNDTERMRLETSGNLVIGGTPAASDARLTLFHTDPALFFHDASAGHQDGAIQVSNGSIKFLNGANANNVSDLSERMRIDSSGNLLVNTTASQSGIAKAAVQFDSGSQYGLEIKDAGAGTTGTFSIFYRGSTNVGSIGVSGGNNPYFSSGAANHGGLIFSDGGSSTPQMNPLSSGSTLADGVMNIGSTSYRFKDLYLSGGVYLGGTGSANKLDDYEEGNFIPYLSTTGVTGNITYASAQGIYTKIGRRVFYWFDFTVSSWSGASGAPLIALPFTSSGTSEMGAFTPWDIHDNFTSGRTPTQWISQSSNWMRVYTWAGDSAMGHNPWAINAIGRIAGSISYTAT